MRTFTDAQGLQDPIDEQDAVEAFAKRLDLAHAILIVRLGAVGWECGAELGKVEHFGWR